MTRKDIRPTFTEDGKYETRQEFENIKWDGAKLVKVCFGEHPSLQRNKVLIRNQLQASSERQFEDAFLVTEVDIKHVRSNRYGLYSQIFPT